MEPALEVTGDRIFKANRSIKREREMTAPELNNEANAPRSKAFFPLLVLGSGIALSILLHFVIKDNVEGEAQLRFERQASDAKHVIEARIHSYAEVMYGLRAMFSASSVSRTEFHRYVAGLDLAHRYPGFWGINYAEWIPNEAKARFEARVRKDTSLDPRGYPKFAIIPPGDRLEYYVLTYLEQPFGSKSTEHCRSPSFCPRQRQTGVLGSIASHQRRTKEFYGPLNAATGVPVRHAGGNRRAEARCLSRFGRRGIPRQGTDARRAGRSRLGGDALQALRSGSGGKLCGREAYRERRPSPIQQQGLIQQHGGSRCRHGRGRFFLQDGTANRSGQADLGGSFQHSNQSPDRPQRCNPSVADTRWRPGVELSAVPRALLARVFQAPGSRNSQRHH